MLKNPSENSRNAIEIDFLGDWMASASLLGIAQKASYCQYTYENHPSSEFPHEVAIILEVTRSCFIQ